MEQVLKYIWLHHKSTQSASDTDHKQSDTDWRQPITIRSYVGFSTLPKGTPTHGRARREPNLWSSNKRSTALLLHHGCPLLGLHYRVPSSENSEDETRLDRIPNTSPGQRRSGKSVKVLERCGQCLNQTENLCREENVSVAQQQFHIITAHEKIYMEEWTQKAATVQTWLTFNLSHGQPGWHHKVLRSIFNIDEIPSNKWQTLLLLLLKPVIPLCSSLLMHKTPQNVI